ncbi:zymogen granule membrane protein 16-like [Gymnodraco acuticeps]|uniref:Zymogen granule membrane protein 16-like n=1 Tax=Gymnodraco acuticeps TaxID=8218 RepID=A0A6P8U2U3_GYMAC|nr:zymogen granule membrane protein 16-like [Gymnodraco acuticeps]XP_034066378.1 zymogen granule membrane protein 16-like [Gymnodraco acuticeps]XP_034071037.1 zymogen granule membrane protein 16-like [Gymnodraco acuticeps]XP_034071038.1 zymogen granule membrane protein 16-like [Gymnodraco acuticeps]XP_034071039.1 zymogen granule membrane protein 16-like [Gymnodraco acuticeps]XP_034071040.1 zymogen granule membrane protein 16-like [Gymnodraco acuticeps]
MLFLAIFAVIAASAIADPETQSYSYSPPAGSGSGSPFSIIGEGRITAVRVWESSYIRGFQFRYGFTWSSVSGTTSGQLQERELSGGEAIIQISGMYSHYVQSVVFVTSKGRHFEAGQPSGTSFNMYPSHKGAELVLISGTTHGGITSIAAIWGRVDTSATHTDH